MYLLAHECTSMSNLTAPVVHPLDVSFVLAVTAAGMLFPPLALAVGAAYFGLSAWLARRAGS